MKYLFLLESFISAWACTRIMGIPSMSIGGSILFLSISVLFYYIRNNFKPYFTKRSGIIFTILSIILTAFFVCSEIDIVLMDLSNILFKACILLVTIIGLILLFFYSCILILGLIEEKKTQKIVETKHPKLYKYFPLISFIICFLLWLPWFLYSYPGIMTPDSINQLEQIVGLVSKSNHHPYVHTLTIKLFYNLGLAITKNPNGGIGCYVIFQMLFLSFANAFLIKTVQDFQPSKNLYIPVIILGFVSLIPYNAVMSITVWKDAFFGGVCLLFSTIIFRCVASEKSTILDSLAYLISCLAFCLYRSNGFYAFLLYLPFSLFIFWRKDKHIFTSGIAVLIIAILIKGPIMNYYNIEQPDFVESLCIPIQQVASVIANEEELSDTEWEQINQVIDPTYVGDLYAPDFADNIKELVRAGNQNYLIENKTLYRKLYLDLAFKYPKDYFYAYVNQTYGYYDPVSKYNVADVEGIIENEVGVYSSPIILSHGLLKCREIMLKLHTIIPVYGTLWSMGCMFWYSLILLSLVFAREKKETSSCWLPFVPSIAIIITLMIATPVATEFRYAYGLFTTIPLLAFISLSFMRKR